MILQLKKWNKNKIRKESKRQINGKLRCKNNSQSKITFKKLPLIKENKNWQLYQEE